MLVMPQDAVGQRAVSQQLYRTIEVLFEPFTCDTFGGRMIVQGFVDAGHGLDLLQDGADVVADQNDGAVAVDFGQQLVKPCFEPLVDVGAGFVEYHNFGVGDDGTAQQGALQLSAAQCTDGALFESFQSHAGYHLMGLFAVLGGEARSQRFLAAEAGEYHFFDGDGKFTVDAVVLGQVAHGDFSRCVAVVGGGYVFTTLRGSEDDFPLQRRQQSENTLYQRSFPSAIGADDAQKIMFVYGQVDIVQHGASVVSGTEVSDFNDRLLGHGRQMFFLRVSVWLANALFFSRLFAGQCPCYFQHFVFPVVGQRIDGHNGSAGLLGYQVGVAAVKFGLHEDNVHIFFLTSIDQLLQLRG